MTETTQETTTTPETTMGSTTTTTSTTSTTTTTTSTVKVGVHTGQVRMFNRSRGYGFITVHSETDSKDVFVHQTNICPALSTYRSLSTGEYVSFDISDDEKRQALNVRGINGGSLRCDAPRRQRNQQGSDDDAHVESGDRRQSGGRRKGGGRRHGGGSEAPRSQQGVSLSEFIPNNAVAAVETVNENNQ